MTNECQECGASLAQNTTICEYCDSTQNDSDQRLLKELMDIKREVAVAMNRGNVLTLKSLLADEYVHVETDAGERLETARKWFVETPNVYQYFISYAISREELLDHTNDFARMRCLEIQTNDSELCPNIFWRGESTFVCRDGRWRLLREEKTTVDENGKEYEP